MIAFNSASRSSEMQQGQPVSAYFEILRDEIPTPFLEKLRQSGRFIYEEAYGRAFLDIFPEPEARDLCGHIRRAIYESQLLKIANECGLACEVHSNKKRTEHHRVVRIGRLCLTASFVQTSQQKPRYAKYRNQAALSPIYAFPTFDFLPKPENYNHDEIYAVVVHGHDHRTINRPAFLSVGIPNRRWKDWLELVPVDVLLEAQKQQRQTTPSEKIKDLVVPKPKKKKRTGEE
jgi:hypothetical protein